MNLIPFFKIITFITFPFFVVGIGFSDWSNKTPYGNEINNFMGTKTLYLNDGQEIDNLTDWYFYKNYAIGKRNDVPYITEDSIDKTIFFVVNEKTLTVKLFNSEATWQTYITNNQIKPKLWTRWYRGPWKFMDDILLILVFGFIITIPLIILLSRSLIIVIKREKFNYKKIHTKIILASILISVSLLLLNKFPQSI